MDFEKGHNTPVCGQFFRCGQKFYWLLHRQVAKFITNWRWADGRVLYYL